MSKEDIWADGYYDGYKAATKWHYPSKGEYPTETDDYLVYVNTKAVRGQKIMAIATYYVGAKEWNIDTDEYEFKYPPIAWMPLPEPPKEEE